MKTDKIFGALAIAALGVASFGQLAGATGYSISGGPQIIQAKAGVTDADLEQVRGNLAASKSLPTRCKVTLRAGNVDSAAYGANCLDDNFSQSGELPINCAKELQTSGGLRLFFDANCLKSEGWAIR